MSDLIARVAAVRSARPLGARLPLVALALLPGATLAQSAPADSPIVPVHHEPHHRQVFQYGTTRILDLQIPPGDRSWFHVHEWPVLYMTLGRSTNRTQNLGQEWSGGGAPRAATAPPPPPPPTAPRATSTTSYVDEPITHRLENIGDTLFRAMVVINETRGEETRSVQAAGFDGVPELENPWFRSYRITLDAGKKSASHRHRTPVVIFQATAGKGQALGPMRFELNEPGQWAFYDAGTVHEVENLGADALELLEIEVRRPD